MKINFFEMIGILPFGIIGILLIILAIYAKIKDIEIKKNGKPVKLKVKEIKEISEEGKDGGKIHHGYLTTFEFKYNNETKIETLNTEKKFKIGKEYRGVYIDNKKKNNLSVSGEGFWLASGGEIIIMAFGLFGLFIFLAATFDFSQSTIIISFIALFAIVLGWLFIWPLFFNKDKYSGNKKKDLVRKIYYEDIENEYSNVSTTLVRYIPKVKKQKKDAQNIPSFLFGSILLGIMGSICFYGGIQGVKYYFNIKFNWIEINANIVDIYTHYEKNEDGDEIELTGVVYEYEVNDKKYLLEKDSDGLKKLRIGDTETIYYEKDNPENSVLKRGLGVVMFPLILGLLFLEIGLEIYFKEKADRDLYKAYILMGGE